MGDEVEERFGGGEGADGFEDVGDSFVGEELLELEGFFIFGVVVVEGGDDSVEEMDGLDAELHGEKGASDEAVVSAELADGVAGDTGDGVAEGDVCESAEEVVEVGMVLFG